MINRLSKYLGFAFFVFVMMQPATLFGQSFSAEIDAGFASGRFTDLLLIPPIITTLSDLPIRRWEYFDNQTGEEMFLLQYEISGDSAYVANNSAVSIGNFSVPVNQHFWLTAQQRYDAFTGPNALVTLYHDDEDQIFAGFELPTTTRLRLSPEALVAGTADTGIVDIKDDLTSSSIDLVRENFFSCLALGCFHQISLNLVGIDYEISESGEVVGSVPPLITNSFVTSTTLYSQLRGFPGLEPDGDGAFDTSLRLTVAPLTVPEPSSFSLLLVGSLMMAFRRRKYLSCGS